MTAPAFNFQTFPAGIFPAADWDTNWAQSFAIGNIFCTATGINSIALTPASYSPSPAALQSGMKFTFLAPANNTGAITIAFASLGTFSAYDQAGVAISAANSVVAGAYYEAVYDQTLNSSTGGFRLESTGFGGAASEAVFWFNGQGSNLTNGLLFDLPVSFGCIIQGWTIVQDAGSITFDIRKAPFASIPPTSSIVAAAPPTSTSPGATSTTLTGWTIAVSAGDVLRAVISSVSSCTVATLVLKVAKV